MAFRNNNLFTILFIFLCLTLPQLAKSQGIGINNTSPDASAILDLTATDRGLLVPRMTQIQKNAISSPATGLLIFQTDVDIGYYFYDSSAWIKLTSSSETTWTKSGNFVYNSSDSVGIGTSTPNQKLHINGALQTSYLYPGLGNNTVYRYVKFGDPTESWGGLMYNISSTNYGDGDDFTIYTYGGRDLVLRAGSPGEVHIPFGNVGIGTTTPSTKLEIDGQIKITGGSPSANKVLTSDADGLATWEAVPGAEDRQDSNISIAGWYRIAECTGGGKRANATFVLTDKISGGGHSTVAFKIGVSYNQIDNSHFILLSHNYYSTKTFTKIRLLTNTTYDEMYLEVYAARTGNVYSTIYHNHNTDGWNSVDWSAGSIPTGYTATEHSLEAQFAVGNNTESFFVSNDGNVGIGTTAPDTKLHVAGTIRTNDKLEYKDLLDANNITGKIEKIKKLTSSSVVVFEDSYIEITVTSYGDFIKLKAKTGYNGNWNTSRIPWKDDGSCSYAYIGDNLACIYSGASDGSISVSTSTPVIASINTSDGYSKGQADMWVITKEDGSSPLYRITLYKVSSSFGWAIAEAYYD